MDRKIANIRERSILKNMISLLKVEEETLSPEKYLNLNEKDRLNIACTKIIPPRLGKFDFGKIRVTYRTPVYPKEDI